MNARCHWCGSGFVLINGHYWCTSLPCRKRQATYSIGAKDSKSGKWHFIYVPLPKLVETEERASIIIRNGRPHKILLGGAAGPGKSMGGRFLLYRRCLTIPRFEALILRETFPELKRSHLRRMEEEAIVFQRHGVPVDFTPSNFLFKFPNDSLIELGHMDDAEAVKKYLSTEYDAILPDEAVKYNPDALMELVSRARTSKQAVKDAGGPLFLPASNPGGPSSLVLRDLCIDKLPDFDKYPQLRDHYHADEWDYIPANLEDNPYLDADYEADLAMNKPWRFRQLRFNDWDVMAGQFFTTFRSDFHIRDLGNPGPEVEWFRSLDWGYVNPGCCGWWACLPDSRLYRRLEYKFQFTTVPEVAAEIIRLTKSLGVRKIRYTAADPSMWQRTGQTGESIAETFLRNGVPLIKSANDRVNGWQRFREWLRPRPSPYGGEEPWMIVHPDNRYFIRCVTSAVSDKNDPEDVDTNCEDHPLDDARYGLMSRPSPTMLSKKKPLPRNAIGHLLRKEITAAELRSDAR